MGRFENARKTHDEAVERLFTDEGAFEEFLKFSGRLYKNPTVQNIALFAEKPAATMTADISTWSKFGRTVNAGERSTAYIVDGKLKYCFDITQTHGEKIPYKWTLDENSAEEYVKRFNAENSVKFTSLSRCIEYSAAAEVRGRLEFITAGLHIQNDKKQEFEKSFRSMITASAAARCSANSNFNFSGGALNLSALNMIDNAQRGNFLEQIQISVKNVLTSIGKSIDSITAERSINNGRNNRASLERNGAEILSEGNRGEREILSSGRGNMDVQSGSGDNIHTGRRGDNEAAGGSLRTEVERVHAGKLSSNNTAFASNSDVGDSGTQSQPRSGGDVRNAESEMGREPSAASDGLYGMRSMGENADNGVQTRGDGGRGAEVPRELNGSENAQNNDEAEEQSSALSVEKAEQGLTDYALNTLFQDNTDILKAYQNNSKSDFNIAVENSVNLAIENALNETIKLGNAEKSDVFKMFGNMYDDHDYYQKIISDISQKLFVSYKDFSKTHSENQSESKTQNQEEIPDNKAENNDRKSNDTYRIYQIKDGEEYRGIRFMGKSELAQLGIYLTAKDYDLVYEGSLSEFTSDNKFDEIYDKFNRELPSDFSGRSLSVSDVIVISENGIEQANYVDRIGFTKFPEFSRGTSNHVQQQSVSFLETEIDSNGDQLSLFGDEPVANTRNKSVSTPVNKQTYRTNNAKVFYAAAAPDEEHIKHILRGGSNEPKTLLRIVAEFQKIRTLDKALETGLVTASEADNFELRHRAEFLKKEFLEYGKNPDGRGYILENGEHLSAWFDENGITIALSETAFPQGSNIQFSYEQAARRIGAMLENGSYCSQEIIDEAAENFKQDTAQSLAYLCQDVNSELHDNYVFSREMYTGTFPESTKNLKAAFENPEQLQEIISDIKRLIDDYAKDRDVMRFHFHKPDKILEQLQDLKLDLREFKTADGFNYSPKFFITEDETDKLCGAGSSVQDSKFRIYDYFTSEHTEKEKSDFIKHEYGEGGSSRSGFNTSYNSKGLTYTKDSVGGYDNPDCGITLNWNQVSQRIEKIIAQGKFISHEDIDKRIRHAKNDSRTQSNGNSYDDATLKNSENIPKKYNETTNITAEKTENKSLSQFDDDFIPYYKKKVIKAEKSGDFYEFYGEIAKELSEKFDYFLFNKNGQPMVGVPSYKFDDFCGDLYDKGYIVENWEHYQKVIKPQVADDKERERPSVEEENNVTQQEKTAPKELKIGDKFEFKGSVVTVTADYGIYPNDVGVSRGEMGFLITQNVDRDELLSKGKYLGNENDLKSEITKEYEEKISDKSKEISGKNSNQLSLDDIPEKETEIEDKVKEKAPEKPIITTENFKSDGDIFTGNFSQKTRYAANVEAVKILKAIETDNRFATPEEQKILSQYVGWGGIPQVFDSNNAAWSNEYKELKKLLTDDEYKAAAGSTLNAHYTSPTVINAIYKALENMGFKSGNILEPSMGIGNFFGCLPDNMSKSKLYGVELDSITGRIAKQLYPKANITIDGYEKTQMPDNFFDVAVGNVPFGNYKIADRRYDRENFNIHDYFFAKTLDKVAPGGIIAFVTSKGTLDKTNTKAREYLAKRADLICAIRLPNNAFKNNANTEVTSDIVFLQKREKMAVELPDWVYTAKNPDGITVNQYFIDHPEMILGEMKQGVEFSMYGNESETSCVPVEGKVLSEQLDAAVTRLKANIMIRKVEETGKNQLGILSASDDVRNFTYTMINGKMYFRENNIMTETNAKGKTLERIKELHKLRVSMRELIAAQQKFCSDDELKKLQSELNIKYNLFNKKYGNINSTANSSAFSEDDDYSILCALENYDSESKTYSKSDIFTKRTVKPFTEITHADTPQESLQISLDMRGKVDIEYMARLCGETPDNVIDVLIENGQIYNNPKKANAEKPFESYEEASEYLSGNIREKLEKAKEAANKSDEFQRNVTALEKVLPATIDASEIQVRIGINWVELKDYAKFMEEYAGANFRIMNSLRRTPLGEYKIENKSADQSVTATSTYGTSRLNSYSIFERLLNNRDVVVRDRIELPDGNHTYEINTKETQLAQTKAALMKEAFSKWLWDDPMRREKYVTLYNKLFNSIVGREYDGSHQTFPGMTPFIKLTPHQLNAVQRAKLGGNTLLAHCVGAGKSFEMIAATMEKKRLGLINKACVVVPKPLVRQMASEWMRLYPESNILVAGENDFTKKNREKFIGRCCTGDYAAVIMSYQQFEAIEMSPEYKKNFLEREIDLIESGISELDPQFSRRTIKDYERMKKTIEAKIQKLLNAKMKSDNLTFEQLGFDCLVVDEAHNYKNGLVITKMSNVAGVQSTPAQKSEDILMKTQYLNEQSNYKNIILASGTPVAGLQQLNTKFNFNSVFVGNSHDLDHRRGNLALFFKR